MNMLDNKSTHVKATAADGPPAVGVLMPSDWDGRPTFMMTCFVWWGNNGTSYKLFMNGSVVHSVDNLVDNSPNPQTISAPMNDLPNGTYLFTAELTNAFNTTQCKSFTYMVSEGSAGNPPPSPLPLPSPPILNATVKSATSVLLEWSDDNSNVTSHNLKVDDSPVMFGATSPFLVTGLTPNGPHSFMIQAVNSAGAGLWSDATNVTLPALPAIPGAVTDLKATPFDRRIELSWLLPMNATSAELWMDDVVIVGLTSSFVASALVPGSTHTFRVRAVNVAGSGAWSSPPVTSTVPAAPPVPVVPSGLTVTPKSSTQLNVTWNPSVSGDDAKSYVLRRNASELLVGAVTPFAAANLTPNTEYSFEVAAFNAQGQSAFSAPVKVKTPAMPAPTPTPDPTPIPLPAVPTNLRVTALSSNQIDVFWWAAAGATSYSLLKNGTILTGVMPFIDTNVSANTTYMFSVRSTNSAGSSAWSPSVSVTTLPTAPTPGPGPDPTPGPLPAIPTGLTATAISAYQINVVWHGAANASSYDLKRNETIVTKAVPVFVDVGLTPNTTYNYQVRSTNASGSSAWSAAVTAKTAIAPPTTRLTVGQMVDPTRRRALAYFPTWSANHFTTTNPDRSMKSLNEIHNSSNFASIPGVYSHVCVAFALPNFAWSGIEANTWAGTGMEMQAKPKDVKIAIDILKLLGKKVLLSVGGATYNQWTILAQEAGKPGPITRALTTIINDLGFSGLDVDYEKNGTDSATVTEYTNVIITMRQAVDASNQPNKILGIAAWSTGADYRREDASQPGYPGTPSHWGSGGRERLVFSGKTVPSYAGTPYAGRPMTSLLQIVQCMTYDAGFDFYSPVVAWKQYRAIFPPEVLCLVGHEVPPEGWGGAVLVAKNSQAGAVGTISLRDQYERSLNQPYSVENSLNAVISNTVNANPLDGAFIWNVLLPSRLPGLPSATDFTKQYELMLGYVPKPPV